MKRLATGLLVAVGLLLSSPSSAELIVLAAPGQGDAYYADVRDEILDFHIGFARII